MSSANILVQRGEPPAFRRSRGAWMSARTNGETELLVSFMGRPTGFPPGRPSLYVGSAREQDGVLLVSVGPSSEAAARLVSRGRASGRNGVVRVEVSGGWLGRQIIDAADGRRRAVFDGALLLRPAAPDSPADVGVGLVLSSGTGDDRPSWWQACPLPDGTQVSLTHMVSSDDRAPEATIPGKPVEDVTVRGLPGTVSQERDGRRLVTRTLWWIERGATVSVRSAAPGGPGKPGERQVSGVQTLTAFADALI